MARRNKSFEKMNETELAEAYNALLGENKVRGYKLMETAFGSIEKGLKKIASLQEALAAQAEPKEKKARPSKKKVKAEVIEEQEATTEEPAEVEAPIKKMAFEQGPPLKVPTSQLVETICKSRVQTLKGMLLAHLVENMRQMIPTSKLAKHVYGKDSALKFTAVIMGMRDVAFSLHKKNVPFEIRQEQEGRGKEVSFGLYPSKG